MDSAQSNDWFVIISVLGAVQGVFLAAVLLNRKHRSAANGFLAATMLAFSLDLFAAVYQASGVAEVFPHLLGIDYPLAMLYGPFLYFYARMLVNGERTVKPTYWLHFLPFGLLVLFLLPFYFQSGAEKLIVVHGLQSTWWTQTISVITYAKLMYSLLYLVMTLILLKRHRARIKDTFSSTDRITLLWLRNLMAGIVMLASVSIVLYLLGINQATPVIGLDPGTNFDELTLLGITVFVYAFGYLGLTQSEIFAIAVTVADTARSAQESDTKPRYARSGLPPERIEEYARDLQRLMDEEHLYRRGDLTLHDLAEAMSISSHNLTQIINTELGVSFYDFVNSSRVREARERLTNPRNDHFTVLAIGMDAGFNSKSSFNAVFKRHVDMTPSQYRMTVTKESAISGD